MTEYLTNSFVNVIFIDMEETNAYKNNEEIEEGDE